jgi:RHS repeat-associated protein
MANQITSSGYAYDPAGNLKQDSNFKYTYDAWNRLVAVHKAYDDSLVAVYTYDGQGRRITKTVGDTTTHYYYDDAWRVVEEQQSVGSGEAAVTAQYLWSGGDRPVIKWADFVEGEATRTLYYTTDAFGKVTALVDGDSGTVVERYVYDPFGAVTFLQGNQEGQTEWAPTEVEGRADGTASAVGNEILYAGYRYDPETSLYQLRYRQYDPSTGRFLQRDPSGYNGTMNPYGYAGGNPVTSSDPMGLAAGAGGILDLNGYGSYRDMAGSVTLNGGVSGIITPVDPNRINSPGSQSTLSIPYYVSGSLQIAGGAYLCLQGLAFAAFTAETIVGVAGGLSMAGYGADLMSAGYNTLRTGTVQQTNTNKLATSAIVQTGVSPTDAQNYANYVELVGATAGSMGMSYYTAFRPPATLRVTPKAMPPATPVRQTALNATKWQEYERGIRTMYGETSFGVRQFQIVIDGKVVNGVADSLMEVNGKVIAVEAKFVKDWALSIRNPASPIGKSLFAQAEQLRMLQQAKMYSSAFDEVIYVSNSMELIGYYSRVFADNGLTNIRFICTH